MILYVRCRCPKCNMQSNYANGSQDKIVCDFCSFEFDKIDGMNLKNKPIHSKSKMRYNLRKKYVL